jgi:hypothetical protein
MKNKYKFIVIHIIYVSRETLESIIRHFKKSII